MEASVIGGVAINRPDQNTWLKQYRANSAQSNLNELSEGASISEIIESLRSGKEIVNKTPQRQTSRFDGGEDMEGYITVNEKTEFQKIVKQNEVEALAEIGIDINDKIALVDQMHDMVIESLGDLGRYNQIDTQGRETELADFIQAFQKVGKTYGISKDGKTTIKNSIGDETGTANLIHERIESVVDDKTDSYLLTLQREQEGNGASILSITIPLGEKDAEIPSELATISESTGEFKGISFSSAADTLATSFNLAILKFQADATYLEQTSKKLLATFEDKK